MKIAMSSIIKNEINFITSYLEKNKDTDYICLLDTGSTDGTWEYLQEQAKTNPKLIIQQKKYEIFDFSVARNDSFKLIPEDTNLVVMLDIDEYFTDSNWVDIIKNNIKLSNTRKFYTTLYSDGSSYSLTEYPRMGITAKIIETKNIKFYHCVHEVISDDDWDNLGNKEEENVWWNKLCVIHQPDKSKDRQSYVSLCEKRIEEEIAVNHNIEFEKMFSRGLLMFEYYRNNMYQEAIALYNEYLANNEDSLFDAAPCMYKMTNDVQYLRNAISILSTKWYEQHLLYYALKDDFEYCKQYKNIILQKISEHNEEMLQRFKQYDQLGNIIEQMASNL